MSAIIAYLNVILSNVLSTGKYRMCDSYQSSEEKLQLKGKENTRKNKFSTENSSLNSIVLQYPSCQNILDSMSNIYLRNTCAFSV